MESTEDQHRYYYTPLTEGRGGNNSLESSKESGDSDARVMGLGGRDGSSSRDSGEQRYKRYRLGDEKSFDSLFFPEKKLLLKILDNFQHKTGKYGIKGYPHKLGLLLHGPPGTGKSSLIKALALHTERHVIDVPLAKIRTNQDLMDIMFDQNFPVDKQDLPVTLAIDNVIFVMEDVDATSPIVRAREHAPPNVRIPAQAKNEQIYSARQENMPAARRQAGSAERAATALSLNGEGPAVAAISSIASTGTDVAATAATTATASFSEGTTTTATTNTAAVATEPTPGAEINTTITPVTAAAIPNTPATGVAGKTSATTTASPSTRKSGGSTTEYPPSGDTKGVTVLPEKATVFGGANREGGRAAEHELDNEGDDAADEEANGTGQSRASAEKSKMEGKGPAEGKVGDDDEAENKDENNARRSRASAGGSRWVGKYLAKEGEANINNGDAARDKEEENEKGRSHGARPENTLETALLHLTMEAASKKKEEDEKKKAYSTMTDKLDLAGLLNVLDGVVDSPGRIVIMTTNYPYALDAALIRPGRIDKKIHLGYMKYDAAKEMTCHFFEVETLTADQQERLRDIFDENQPSRRDGIGGGGGGGCGRGGGRYAGEGGGRKITPAVVEQLAGEVDTVDDFLEALQAF